MSDTPRMDASAHDDGAIWQTGCELERELNAANSEIDRLTAKVAQLYEGAEEQKQRIKRLEEAGGALLWYFCPKNTGDISFLQSEAIKQWNKAKEDKP
jgi:hypothetical protein